MSEFNLHDELLALTSDPSTYTIPSELEISSLPEAEVDLHLSSAIESIVNDPDSLSHSSPATFDVFRSILKYSDSPSVSAGVLTKLLDAIQSGLSHHVTGIQHIIQSQGFEGGDIDAPLIHKPYLEMWCFLLQWFVSSAQTLYTRDKESSLSSGMPTARGKGSKKKNATNNSSNSFGSIWPDLIPAFLSTSHKTLSSINSSRLFRTSVERDAFTSCFTRPAYQLCENESHLKSIEIRKGIYRTICLAVKFHNHAFGAQTTIIQNLTYFEHLSEPMAELLEMLEKEFDYGQLGEEILREVAGKTQFAAADVRGPKSFSRFLVRMAEGGVRGVPKQMPLLLGQLDNEAYQMRMAIIEIIGICIRDISSSDEGDEEQKKKQIKRYFDLLMERFLDLNSWVRSKVLQTLIKLCDLPAKFPKQRSQITDLTIRTLEDKTSSARRYSIQLLSKLLESHPFGAMHGGTLNLPEWQERYETVNKELEKVDAVELENAKQLVGMTDEDDDAPPTEEGEAAEGSSKRKKRDSTEGRAEDDEEEEGTEVGEEDTEETPKAKEKKRPRHSMDVSQLEKEQSTLDPALVQRLRLTKKYYSDALHFIKQLEVAIPLLCTLLVSTTKSEVLESMKFFRLAYEYNVQGAELGIKKMLHLIWTKDNNAPVNTSTGANEGPGGAGGGGAGTVEKEVVDERSIKGQLIETYKSLYFDLVDGLQPKQQVSRIAKNMIERTYGATLAELTSLEELMRTMMADGGVHPDVITKLWQVYSTDQEIPKQQRQGAIIILGMLGMARKEVVTEKVENLLKIGLGQFGMNDLVLARYTCIALQRLGGSAKKVKGSLTDKTMRLPMDNPIFVKLQEIIENAPKSPYWFGMAEQAINTIYLLGEQPDALCGDLLKNLTARVFSAPSSSTLPSVENEGPTTPTQNNAELPPTVVDTPFTQVEENEGETTMTSPHKQDRSRSGSVAASTDTTGSFTLAQLVFVVGHVAIKHIVYLELVEREFKRRKDEKAKATAAAKAADKDSNDLDAVAGNAEDDIGDLISQIREKELLYGENSLLAVYGPMIAGICASPKRYRSPVLRQAATLSLTKLMCVSAQFCEAHLPLLFNLLEKSKDPVVRSNIVIALGDLAVCFGSLIDDNSDRLYQGLSDPNPSVKKNTLMVLTHLILNGMIKVKGQLGEMAKCLEDKDERISDLAKLFFTELSTKDNALYNNLQDVISHLSVGKFKVDEDCFERTMRFIFTFIEKEKQAESIVEKLCQRFRSTTDERQWRDVAFCLSLLPFKSERSLKKLIDGLPFYQDKLHEETVFRRFTEILGKARANKSANKPETELNEFEAILNEHQAKGLEEQALEADVLKKTKAAKKRAAKKTQAASKTKKGGKKKKDDDDEDDDIEDDDDAATTSRATSVRDSQSASPQKGQAETARTQKTKRAPPSRRGGRKKVVESDDEGDSF